LGINFNKIIGVNKFKILKVGPFKLVNQNFLATPADFPMVNWLHTMQLPTPNSFFMFQHFWAGTQHIA